MPSNELREIASRMRWVAHHIQRSENGPAQQLEADAETLELLAEQSLNDVARLDGCQGVEQARTSGGSEGATTAAQTLQAEGPQAFIVVSPDGATTRPAGVGSLQRCKGPGCDMKAMVNGYFDAWFCSATCYHHAARQYAKAQWSLDV